MTTVLTTVPLSDAHQSEQGASWYRVGEGTWARGDTPGKALHQAAEISRALVSDVAA